LRTVRDLTSGENAEMRATRAELETRAVYGGESADAAL